MVCCRLFFMLQGATLRKKDEKKKRIAVPVQYFTSSHLGTDRPRRLADSHSYRESEGCPGARGRNASNACTLHCARITRVTGSFLCPRRMVQQFCGSVYVCIQDVAIALDWAGARAVLNISSRAVATLAEERTEGTSGHAHYGSLSHTSPVDAAFTLLRSDIITQTMHKLLLGNPSSTWASL
ncbi:hypothetical protein CBL_10751 [Carabus blaptoides fortunei]